MLLYIKNMVCHRCVLAVQDILRDLRLKVSAVRLGEVEIEGEIDDTKRARLEKRLQAIGFQLIDDRKSKTIQRVKAAIIDFVQHADTNDGINLSDFLAEKLYYDYKYLSSLFSEVEGTTIEKYYIAQRVERIKEMVVYDELSIKEIADQLGYSSPSYLTSQFKKATGLTPSHFKRVGKHKRKPIDKL